MNIRLQQFLSAENLSQAQFADIIGVARASVSHIIAGRNKPGFDFIYSMAANFPNLNVEWLVTGRGKMYKTPNDLFPAETVEAPQQPQIAPAVAQEPQFAAPAPAPEPAPSVTAAPPQEPAPTQSNTSNTSAKVTVGQRNISKMIILFDDNTYQALV